MVSGCSDSEQKDLVGAVAECRVRESREIARGHSALVDMHSALCCWDSGIGTRGILIRQPGVATAR